jgi:glucose-6-phosphate isomerase
MLPGQQSLTWNGMIFNRLFKEYNQPSYWPLIGIGKWSRFKKAISDYFDGEIINQTENRAVLHTALRAKESGL